MVKRFVIQKFVLRVLKWILVLMMTMLRCAVLCCVAWHRFVFGCAALSCGVRAAPWSI